MKRLAVLAMAAVIISAAMASGAVQDFGAFTADIPEGWTAAEDNGTVFITKDGTEGSDLVAVSITYDSTEGNSAKDIADAFVQKFKDVFPLVLMPEADEDGDYTWSMVNSDGANIRALLGVEDGRYVLVMMSGFDEAGEEILDIIGSVQDK